MGRKGLRSMMEMANITKIKAPGYHMNILYLNMKRPWHCGNLEKSQFNLYSVRIDTIMVRLKIIVFKIEILQLRTLILNTQVGIHDLPWPPRIIIACNSDWLLIELFEYNLLPLLNYIYYIIPLVNINNYCHINWSIMYLVWMM